MDFFIGPVQNICDSQSRRPSNMAMCATVITATATRCTGSERYQTPRSIGNRRATAITSGARSAHAYQ